MGRKDTSSPSLSDAATFEEKSGKTLVVMHELYPSKEALEASGAHDGMPETFDQLEEFLTGR